MKIFVLHEELDRFSGRGFFRVELWKSHLVDFKRFMDGNVLRLFCAFRLQIIDNKQVTGGGGGSRTRHQR